MTKLMTTTEDLMIMLDDMLREPTAFWNEFYKERGKKVPFFVNAPDENLVQYFERGLLQKGTVLELGCGAGRNALYLAKQGFHVHAVDLSSVALQWAKERAMEAQVHIQFEQANLFELPLKENHYDFIYDAGCLHHIAPHRRLQYVEIVQKALKKGGYFAVNCFAENGAYGGSTISDWEVYRQRSLQGGLGYTKEKLQAIFNAFQEIEIRAMRPIEQPSTMFGLDGFIVAIFKK
ncbi:class I SAM-dependent methyltransferase [Metasolibacillus meyeri]|uniref:class I SAM-dependent methyltransferase n=1 Tax=Metasolibacillus meyeri TaxID=1071052 RepID=UPI000D30960C|nr:class I SAM-dependent methyltransferase [Metasolibacillus meyeri]